MTRPVPSSTFEPDLVLLLCGDPNDAVTRALVDRLAPLGWPLAAVSMQQLIEVVEMGDEWVIAGHRIQPHRTALINRLPMADRLEPGDATPESAVARQTSWSRLRRELGRFGYVSSLPTASSIMGCYGSLLDQWQDLPRLVPALRVPEHSTPAFPRKLRGPVFAVDRWTPYSLGTPVDEAPAAGLHASVRLDYVRPEGSLVHLAQVGGATFFPNAPPTMTERQWKAMTDMASALAALSPVRILEHAFFLGHGAPVLYSCCPVPVISGAHPLYPSLVQQGLRHDIQHWRRRHRT